MSKKIGTENSDTELIEKTIRQYADMIIRIAYQNTKSYSDAEDILQEVSVALVTSKAPLGDDTHLKHWLIRVTVNKCHDLHKSYWRRNVEPIDDHPNLVSPEHEEVLEEVFRLPENYRNTIYLYYYENFSIAEIAETLDRSPNTISTWLRRGRKKLKEFLVEGGFQYE